MCLCVGKCDYMHAKFGFLKAFMLNLPYIKMTKSEKKMNLQENHRLHLSIS